MELNVIATVIMNYAAIIVVPTCITVTRLSLASNFQRNTAKLMQNTIHRIYQLVVVYKKVR